MCDQAVDNYSHALRFVLDCFKTQKMCNKAVGTCPYSNNLWSPGLPGTRFSPSLKNKKYPF